MGTVVNRALESLHGGSLSDELLGGKCQQRESKNVFMNSYTSVRTRKLCRINVYCVLLFTKLRILYLKRFSTDLSPGGAYKGGNLWLSPPPLDQCSLWCPRVFRLCSTPGKKKCKAPCTPIYLFISKYKNVHDTFLEIQGVPRNMTIGE